MLITLLQLEKEPLLFDESVAPGVIDFSDEVEQKGTMTAEGRADLIEEHHGPKQIVSDIRLRAEYEGRFLVPCARCLEPVEHAIRGDFDLIFRPLGVEGGGSEHSITDAETEIGYYQKDSLLLEDVLREQVLLSLPAKTLCREDCKGLCPHCGRNLNSESCTCVRAPADPRWSALQDLSSRLKS
ncbi:MAG: YceD family protein [Acidobacteriaceae bacterium]